MRDDGGSAKHVCVTATAWCWQQGWQLRLRLLSCLRVSVFLVAHEGCNRPPHPFPNTHDTGAAASGTDGAAAAAPSRPHTATAAGGADGGAAEGSARAQTPGEWALAVGGWVGGWRQGCAQQPSGAWTGCRMLHEY